MSKTITVNWPLATTRNSGAIALPASQIAATKMYMSQNGGSFDLYQTRTPTETQNAVVSNCPDGVYAFKFSTVDTDGQEGPLSAALSITIGSALPALPDPPALGGVTIDVAWLDTGAAILSEGGDTITTEMGDPVDIE